MIFSSPILLIQPQERVCPFRSEVPFTSVILPHSHWHLHFAYPFSVLPAYSKTVNRPYTLPISLIY